jgi:hypothetical protein
VNIFSVNEPAVELDPSFATAAQAGGSPVAPPTNPVIPLHPPVPLPTVDLESLARRSAPGSATSSDLTYTWRK